MKVTFVGAGPGALDLLTVRADRILRAARICIYAGSLVSPDVVALLPQACEKHDSASLSLDEMEQIYREAQHRNVDVVRLHSGDPSIYGAIREQMNVLDTLGISYEVVPGVSSFQASAAALKTELTAPEVSQSIVLTRTAGRTPLPEAQEIENFAKTGATLCLFLSALKVEELTRRLAVHYGEDCPIAAVFHASWPDQRILRGTLANFAEIYRAENLDRTVMILVGRALSRDIPVSKLYDAGFTHGCRQASSEEQK